MSVQSIAVNQIATFPVTFQDSSGDAAPAPDSVTFVSSNPSVATVSYANGVLTVTPVEPGASSITAPPLLGELDIEVVPSAATAFTVGVATLTLKS